MTLDPGEEIQFDVEFTSTASVSFKLQCDYSYHFEHGDTVTVTLRDTIEGAIESPRKLSLDFADTRRFLNDYRVAHPDGPKRAISFLEGLNDQNGHIRADALVEDGQPQAWQEIDALVLLMQSGDQREREAANKFMRSVCTTYLEQTTKWATMLMLMMNRQ